MANEEKQELSKSISTLTEKIDHLGTAIGFLNAVLREILEELKRKKDL